MLDTSFLIAVNNRDDQNYERAQSLKSHMRNKDFGQVYISDYVFDELFTFLRARAFSETLMIGIGNKLLADEDIKLLQINTDIFLQSWDLFKKISGLSFTDCTTVILVKQYGIKRIASFDSDFDRISFLERM